MRKHRDRKPVEMEMVGGKGSRQRVWEAIRKYAGAFTCYQISRKAKADDGTVYTYLRSLEKGGYIEGQEGNQLLFAFKEKKWKLVRDNGVEAPRLTRDGKPVVQGMGNEAMWRSMRIVGEFNARELAAHASASGIAVKEQTAKSYISALKAAEYLATATGAASKGIGKGAVQARYRLAPGKYTGPRPPMIQRTKSVYDPNLGKVVWQEPEVNDDDL
jgi:hypothetical protein